MQCQISAMSDVDLHYLPLIKPNVNTTIGSKMDLFAFKDKYGNELRCSNI